MATSIADTPLPSVEDGGFSMNGMASDQIPRRNTYRPREMSADSTVADMRTPSTSTASSPERVRPGLEDQIPASGETATETLAEAQDVTVGLSNMRLASIPRAFSDTGHEQGDSGSRPAFLTVQGEASGVPSSRRRSGSRRSSGKIQRVRHEVSDEEPPQSSLHAPEIQKAVKDAKKLMSDMSDLLCSSDLHRDQDSTIQGLHGEAVELSKFQYPSTRTVGFVGDSGVGKSSIINSLLDRKSLARTSGGGRACTCVVTEYHHHTEETLDINVNFFTMDDLRKQLKSLLQSYRNFHLHVHEISDNDERRHAEDRAQIAIDTFDAMINGTMYSQDFLIDDPEDDALQKLMEWVEDARPPESLSRHSNLSLDECSTILMGLSSDSQTSDQPASWPYIKNIQVFLNAHILSTGLILVDLPGLRDLNSARRNITEQYMLRCNEIFVICGITRAVTDEGVDDIFDLAKRARLSNVGILCTRSEEIQPEEAIQDWNDNRGAEIRKMVSALDVLNAQAMRVQDSIDYYDDDADLSDGERDEQLGLMRTQRSIETRRKQQEFKLKTELIGIRNEEVSKELREMYGTSNQPITAFCISNTLYWENRELPRDEALQYLHLSGIIDARRHCMSIVAKSQWHATKRYIGDKIPAFLAQVDIWIQSGARSGSQEEREALCSTLNGLRAKVVEDFSSPTSPLRRVDWTIQEQFESRIELSQNLTSWSQSARDACQEWSGWHHSTYSAFCRNFGDHHTSLAGRRNWNDEAIAQMVADLKDPWERLCAEIDENANGRVAFVGSVTRDAVGCLSNESRGNEHMPEALTEMVDTQRRLLLNSIRRVHEEFQDDLELLRVVALTGIRSSLVGRSLESSYQNCNLDSGGRSHARRKAIIKAQFDSQNLFRSLIRNWKKNFEECASGYQAEISSAVSRYIDVLGRNFDLVGSENVARESERDPEFRDRVSVGAQKTWDGIKAIQSAIDGF